MKEGPSGGGMDEADKVSPLVAMLHRSQGALAVETPHFVQERLEPNPVFIHCPQLDDAVWKRGGDFTQERA
jgi:hypothetical protein